ncbi:hypothetical protein HN385_05600 [archaeon]|nr:hypothetical protein [archaeon]MBT3450554.1 hypothetical protein [archaeon]MBT6868526.1 hypothetical protein [archaeon]MBT7193060.1 hypothetical protein [archaeon]MBT7381149.1 hypothetical protein [archaeon]
MVSRSDLLGKIVVELEATSKELDSILDNDFQPGFFSVFAKKGGIKNLFESLGSFSGNSIKWGMYFKKFRRNKKIFSGDIQHWITNGKKGGLLDMDGSAKDGGIGDIFGIGEYANKKGLYDHFNVVINVKEPHYQVKITEFLTGKFINEFLSFLKSSNLIGKVRIIVNYKGEKDSKEMQFLRDYPFR